MYYIKPAGKALKTLLIDRYFRAIFKARGYLGWIKLQLKTGV